LTNFVEIKPPPKTKAILSQMVATKLKLFFPRMTGFGADIATIPALTDLSHQMI